MNSSHLHRRTLLAGLVTAPIALSPTEASAAQQWRRMSEPVRRPTTAPGKPIATGSIQGMVTVSTDPIPRVRLADGRLVIHPTSLGNLLNAHVTAYGIDGRREHLNMAATITQALMDRAALRQGGRFVKYEFTWHDEPNPWYSAFGQSKFPRVTGLLARHTGERKWARYCEELLTAFRLPPTTSSTAAPWIAGVDANNCLWLEEYPKPDLEFSTVFNGHFYALAELAAYAEDLSDDRIEDIIQGAAATLDFYRSACRAPGRFSNYFANSTTNVASYHWINAACYRGLFEYTGVERLARTVDEMARDWPFTTNGNLVLQVQPKAQYITRAPGRTSELWLPSRALRLSADRRTGVKLRPSVWTRMASGPYAGWWIQEIPGHAYCLGEQVDRVGFGRPRRVAFAPGTRLDAWSIDATGVRTLVRTRTLTTRSFAHSRVRARIAGAHHLLIEDGMFAGLWLRESEAVSFR